MAHQTKEYPADSVLEKALSILDGVSNMVFKLNSAMAGVDDHKPINRQTVQGWRNRANFPARVIPYIHKLTRIPQSELIAALAKQKVKPKAEESAQE